MKPQRTCLECGDPFQGRTDKKFCGDHCRSGYNNRLSRTHDSLIRQVNRILKKNQAILARQNSGEPATVNHTDLVRQGFDFGYFTHIRSTGSRVWFFCYDQGYALSGKNKIRLYRGTRQSC